MRPKVIVHQAISLDGRIDGFAVDPGQFYGLAARFEEDATLAGSETLIAAGGAEGEEAIVPVPQKGDRRPLLVAVDSRGRIRSWSALLSSSHWRGGIALSTFRTPKPHLAMLERCGVSAWIVGDERVDLAKALELLQKRYGIQRLRVESGGELSTVLLRAGLVDVVSLFVHPVLVGPKGKPFFRPEDGHAAALHLLGCEAVFGDKVWLRYEVPR